MFGSSESEVCLWLGPPHSALSRLLWLTGHHTSNISQLFSFSLLCLHSFFSGKTTAAVGSTDRESHGKAARVIRGACGGQVYRRAGHTDWCSVWKHTPPRWRTIILVKDDCRASCPQMLVNILGTNCDTCKIYKFCIYVNIIEGEEEKWPCSLQTEVEPKEQVMITGKKERRKTVCILYLSCPS